MAESWIKLHRKFLDWEWYGKSEMVHLFLHLLLKANSEDRRWRGMIIKRGQLVTGRNRLIEETGISERTVRTCLQRLQETGEIEVEPSNRFSLITITNYESYQTSQSESVQQTTNESPSIDQSKPKKTKEEIKADTDKRMKAFYNSLVPYLQTYPKEMIRAFYDYWSETNKSGSKMKWEQESTWVLEKRLQRWSQHDKSYKSKSNGKDDNRTSTAEARAKDAAAIIASLAAEE